jgi:hypothetical protein
VNPTTGHTVFEDLADSGTVELGQPIMGLLEAPRD